MTAVASFLAVKLLGVAPTDKSSTLYTATSLVKRQPDAYREDLTTVLDLLAAEQVHPVIGERFPLAQVARAHELLARSSTGKIVLTSGHEQ
ncbi:MAG: zinc-binding dehydrogenase [Geodermatophilaceae bacterium]|nr:zinc-binding dehydrogenase [Geodermatophilaceae bacterium]